MSTSTAWAFVPARPQAVFSSNAITPRGQLLRQPARCFRQYRSGCTCQAAKGFAPTGKSGSKVNEWLLCGPRMLVRHGASQLLDDFSVWHRASCRQAPRRFMLQKNKRKLDASWIGVGSMADFPVNLAKAIRLLSCCCNISMLVSCMERSLHAYFS